MNTNFNSFINEVEEKATEIKVGGDSPIEFRKENEKPCPDFKTLLPEYFTKDGIKLMDTKTGDVFRLSQSFIASLREALIEDKCLYRLWFGSVLRKMPKKWGETDAMRMGTYFEFMLTGAMDYYGDIPTAKIGNVGKKNEGITAAFKRLIENAEHAKNSLKDKGINLDEIGTYNADEKMIFRCTDGSMDLHFLDNRIYDVKYSAVLFNDWSDYSWDDKSVGESFGKLIQATLYSYLHIVNSGIQAPFAYIVFSNKAAELKDFQIFEVNISQERFNMLEWLLIDVANLFQSMINENKFIEKPSFDNCKGCPVLDCNVKQVYRKNIIVNI